MECEAPCAAFIWARSQSMHTNCVPRGATMNFTLHQGNAPLLVSMPHVGTHIPPALHNAYVPRALAVEDTDWHLPQLYNFLAELGASVLVAQTSRYVIDLN